MKRKKTGKTVNWQNLKDRYITKEEKVHGSPYWAWMEKSGPQNEDGEIMEFAQANPDVLGQHDAIVTESEYSEGLIEDTIKSVLTENQAKIMLLLLEGFSQTEIARNLDMKQGYVSRAVTSAKKKLQKYL